MKTIRCYRFVKEDMTSDNGECSWELGKWSKVEGDLRVCQHGLHACRTPLQSINNVFGSRWFIGEARGQIIDSGNKFCASEMRLLKELPVKTIVVEFAVACALRVIKVFEKQYPNDDRPRKAIKAAQAYLKNASEALASAARSAAYAADAAAYTAADAAYTAAYAAAAAAYAAAAAAYTAAERKWQEKKIMALVRKYSR